MNQSPSAIYLRRPPSWPEPISDAHPATILACYRVVLSEAMQLDKATQIPNFNPPPLNRETWDEFASYAPDLFNGIDRLTAALMGSPENRDRLHAHETALARAFVWGFILQYRDMENEKHEAAP